MNSADLYDLGYVRKHHLVHILFLRFLVRFWFGLVVLSTLQGYVTLEIQSSLESTIWICSASHSGNEQYTHSPIPLEPNVNQSHRRRCIWYRLAKKRCCFTDRIWQGSYLLVSSAGLDTSPLVFLWLVVELSNCVQWYFQMLGAPCQTLQHLVGLDFQARDTWFSILSWFFEEPYIKISDGIILNHIINCSIRTIDTQCHDTHLWMSQIHHNLISMLLFLAEKSLVKGKTHLFK